MRGRLEAAPDGVPRCDCGAALKPDVVLFGELLPEASLARASALAAQADLLLCVGSSLEVYPVAQLPAITLAGGGSVALVTMGPTPYDGDAVVKLDGDVVVELSDVAGTSTATAALREGRSARSTPVGAPKPVSGDRR